MFVNGMSPLSIRVGAAGSAMSQTATAPSRPPTASIRPSGENAEEVTTAWAAGMTATGAGPPGAVIDHSCRPVPRPPTASREPSGEIAMVWTSSVVGSPGSSTGCRGSASDQRTTAPPAPPASRVLPSGLNTTPKTPDGNRWRGSPIPHRGRRVVDVPPLDRPRAVPGGQGAPVRAERHRELLSRGRRRRGSQDDRVDRIGHRHQPDRAVGGVGHREHATVRRQCLHGRPGRPQDPGDQRFRGGVQQRRPAPDGRRGAVGDDRQLSGEVGVQRPHPIRRGRQQIAGHRQVAVVGGGLLLRGGLTVGHDREHRQPGGKDGQGGHRRHDQPAPTSRTRWTVPRRPPPRWKRGTRPRRR